MSQPRKIKIKTLSDYNSGSGYNPQYGFVFSDDINDWMGSAKIEKLRETSRKHYRKRLDRAGI